MYCTKLHKESLKLLRDSQKSVEAEILRSLSRLRISTTWRVFVGRRRALHYYITTLIFEWSSDDSPKSPLDCDARASVDARRLPLVGTSAAVRPTVCLCGNGQMAFLLWIRQCGVENEDADA
jgi:hypothetical protein